MNATMTTTAGNNPTRTGRSEVEVAADTVAAILESGHVKRTGAMVAALAKAAGVTVADVTKAWRRYSDGRWIAPRQRVAPLALVAVEPNGVTVTDVDADDEFVITDRKCPVCGAPIEKRRGAGRPPVYCSRVCQSKNSQIRPRTRRAHNRLPDEPTRICGRCGDEKPIEAFPIRTDHGTRRSWCDVCLKEYQRNRYFSIEKQRVVAKLMEGDPCVGSRCPRCRQPFEVGQTIVASGLHHADCAAERPQDPA